VRDVSLQAICPDHYMSTMRAWAVRARNERSILRRRCSCLLGLQLLRIVDCHSYLPELMVLVLRIVVEFFLILFPVLNFPISQGFFINLIVQIFVAPTALLLYVPGSKMFM
jgi:hypothetical protein